MNTEVAANESRTASPKPKSDEPGTGQPAAVAHVCVSCVHRHAESQYPKIDVPDPTAHLVGMMRDFVELRGARFLVGLQRADPALEPFLRAEKIPCTRFDGVATIRNDDHWSPGGHAMVARRLMTLLAAEKVLGASGDKR